MQRQHRHQTSMSTMRRMMMKPMTIIRPPRPRMNKPSRQAEHGSVATCSMGAMNVGAMTDRSRTRATGRKPDDVARHALLRGQGPDLALDAHALADGVGDRVEDLGEVAADLVLDGDGGDHQIEVVRLHAPADVGQRVVERQAQVDLADDAAELGRDGRLRLAHDHLDRLQEGRAGAQRVGQQHDRVGQAVVERLEPLALASVEPELGQPEADADADQPQQRAAEERDERAEHDHDQRHADDRGEADGQELGRLESDIGARELAGQVGAPVALLDDTVEVGQGDRALEALAQVLACRPCRPVPPPA